MANESEYKRTTGDHGGETPDVHHIGNPDVLHEKNDVNVFAIIKFVVGLTIGTFAVFGLMFAMMQVLTTVENRREDPASPLARSRLERLPPNPRLQGAPGHSFEPDDVTSDPATRQRLAEAEGRKELNFELDVPMMEWDVLRKYQLEELQSYGRDVRRPGELRIPIERAKELLLERNLLASRQQQQPPQQQQSQQQQQQAAGAEQSTVTIAGDEAAEQVRQNEGYDALPTYQSSGQKAERRRQ